MRPRSLLILLLVIDGFFIVLHTVSKGIGYDPLNDLLIGLPLSEIWFPFISSRSFYLPTDWGFPESIQYVKECLIIVILLLLANHSRVTAFYKWAVLFFLLFLVHAFHIHSYIYYFSSALFGIQIPLSSFFVRLLLFIPVVFLIIADYIKYGWGNVFHTIYMIAGFLFLFVFGVLADLLNHRFHHLVPGLGVTEDGGQMIALSFILFFVYADFQFVRIGNTQGVNKLISGKL